jgi:hypothetical protein
MCRVKTFFVSILFPFFIYASGTNPNQEAMIQELHQVNALSIITKDYVMVAMHNTFNNPMKDMQKEIDRFNALQKTLLALPLDKASRSSIAKRQERWKEIEAFLKTPINKEGFLKLRKLIYPLRSKMREHISSMRKKIKSEHTDTIYYAGKLTAISQEFAGIYLLLKWGTNTDIDKLKVDILIQSSMYVDTLSRLGEMPSLDSASQKMLKKLNLYFQYLSYINRSTKTFTPVLVYRKANMMSKYSNKIMEIARK